MVQFMNSYAALLIVAFGAQLAAADDAPPIEYAPSADLVVGAVTSAETYTWEAREQASVPRAASLEIGERIRFLECPDRDASKAHTYPLFGAFYPPDGFHATVFCGEIWSIFMTDAVGSARCMLQLTRIPITELRRRQNRPGALNSGGLRTQKAGRVSESATSPKSSQPADPLDCALALFSFTKDETARPEVE